MVAASRPLVVGGAATGVPALPWFKVGLLALLLFAASLGSIEAYWRGCGFQPSVPESQDLWYFWRQRVYRPDGKVIVLAGTSRIRADISLRTMRECLPDYRIVQLGLNGADSCVGLLSDLALDEAFRGVVVCELDTPLLQRLRWEAHSSFFNYRPPSRLAHFEALADAWMGGYFVVRDFPFRLRAVLQRLVSPHIDEEPGRPCQTFRRESQYDFARVRDLNRFRRRDFDAHRRRYEQAEFRPWRDLAGKDTLDVDALVRRVQKRGGRVVFLRAPSTGEHWQLEKRFHPKSENWDRFAQLTGGLCIHFQDLPDMRTFNCPDGSHLDVRDAPRFTRAFVRELIRRGALFQPTPPSNPGRFL